MLLRITLVVFFIASFCHFTTAALDKALAESLTKTAITLNAQGNAAKAREMLYTALANDENCALALYEMSAFYEKDGKPVTAGEFLNKAIIEFKKSGATYQTQLADAQRRIRRLNPFAERYAQAMEAYANEIVDIVKRQPDSITNAEGLRRAEGMLFSEFIGEDKLLAIRKSVPGGGKGQHAQQKSGGNDNSGKKGDASSVVPFEVERELKQAGWESVTGKWKKVANNTYEVTNGVLTANIANGTVGTIVHRGTGKVSVFVRANYKPRTYTTMYNSYTGDYGFGLKVEGGNATRVEPYSYTIQPNYLPIHQGSMSFTENYPKNIITINVIQNTLTFHVNNRQVRKFTNPITADGPFMIRVDGTAIIETPVARGQ